VDFPALALNDEIDPPVAYLLRQHNGYERALR
jgi:hypothetical protein